MENTTVNTSVNNNVNASVMEAFKELQARAQSQEIVIFEMPIMESQTILPSSDMTEYLSEDFSNEKEIETRFSGERYSTFFFFPFMMVSNSSRWLVMRFCTIMSMESLRSIFISSRLLNNPLMVKLAEPVKEVMLSPSLNWPDFV